MAGQGKSLCARGASCCQPRTDRVRHAPGHFHRRNSVSAGPSQIFNLFQATVNVSYAPDVFGGQRRQIEATSAATEYQRFELEATYLTLTANVVTAAIQEACCAARSLRHKTSSRPKPTSWGWCATNSKPARQRVPTCSQQESEVATTEATLPPLQKQLEQQRHVLLALVGRFPSEAVAITSSLRRSGCRPLAGQPSLAPRRAAARRPRGAVPVAPGERADRRRDRQQAAAIQSHRTIRQRRADAGERCSRRPPPSGVSPERAPSRFSMALLSCTRSARQKPPSRWRTRSIATR